MALSSNGRTCAFQAHSVGSTPAKATNVEILCFLELVVIWNNHPNEWYDVGI